MPEAGIDSYSWQKRKLNLKVFTAAVFFLKQKKGRRHMSQLRRSSAAGYFYPGDKDKLREQVDWLLRIGYKDKIFEIYQVLLYRMPDTYIQAELLHLLIIQ